MQHGMQAHFQKHRVLNAWPKASEAFVKNVHNQSQAIAFENGVLTVACLTGEVAKEIGYMKDAIKTALNRILAESAVKEIILEV